MVASLKLKGSAEDSMQMYYAIVIIYLNFGMFYLIVHIINHVIPV